MTQITDIVCDMCDAKQHLPNGRYESTFLHLERGSFPYNDEEIFGSEGRPRHLCNKCALQVYEYIKEQKINNKLLVKTL